MQVDHHKGAISCTSYYLLAINRTSSAAGKWIPLTRKHADNALKIASAATITCKNWKIFSNCHRYGANVTHINHIKVLVHKDEHFVKLEDGQRLLHYCD